MVHVSLSQRHSFVAGAFLGSKGRCTATADGAIDMEQMVWNGRVVCGSKTAPCSDIYLLYSEVREGRFTTRRSPVRREPTAKTYERYGDESTPTTVVPHCL